MNSYPLTYAIKKSKITGDLAFSGPCPACAADLKIKEDEIGKRQQCPNCRTIIKPVSAILKAYKLTESQKSMKDSVAVLTSQRATLQRELTKLREERDALQSNLLVAQDEYNKAVHQINDLRAEVCLQEDSFLPDLTPEQPPPSQSQYQTHHRYSHHRGLLRESRPG